MLLSVFQQIVNSVTPLLPGLRLPGITTANIFPFIQAGTMVNGMPVRIVIPIRLIMHRILVMLFVIKAIIIRMRIVTHVTRGVTHEKYESLLEIIFCCDFFIPGDSVIAGK
jgi:hypothetical protein